MQSFKGDEAMELFRIGKALEKKCFENKQPTCF